MNDTAIKNYCIWARAELLNEVENRMQRYGIMEEGAEPADAQTVGGRALSTQEQKQRAQLLEMQARMSHDALRDKAAYTWFNRIIAVRFMELHDYLPSGVHVFCAVDNLNAFEPEIVKEALDVDLPDAKQEEIVPLMQAGEDEPLFRYLFLAQCNELAECLPAVFEPVGSALELLLPTGLLRKESVVGQLVAQLPWSGEDEAGIGWSKVEILGWMYQFYNSQVKDEFFKSKRKATARDIAPATQLFTPEWIVRYMVENSLGRLWMLNNPESTLRESMGYYIEPDTEHEDFIHIEGPEDISLCDPACGSGHILVYAFDLLFQMYTERGYREREIPQLILENNLTGMEIDPRAAQFAHLALAMCAREHDRRFFSRGVQADINVIAPTVFEEDELPEGAALLQQPQLLDALAHLDEIGSLLNPTKAELAAVRDDAQRFVEAGQVSLFGANIAEKLNQAKLTCETLARKFTCVVANPPYMGSSSFSPFMSKWIKKNCPDVKSDLFSSFIVRIMDFADAHGEAGLMTPFVWMFIGSYEKLRKKLIEEKTITSLVQLEYSGFAGATVPICTFTFHNCAIEGYRGGYVRLSDFVGAAKQAPKTREAIANPECGYFYRRNAKTFTQIPGTPIAYWASDAFVEAFENGRPLESVATPRQGLATSDNNRFLRKWWEIDPCDCSRHCVNREDAKLSGKKWFPIIRGGAFRKWFGEYDEVVNWFDDGKEMKDAILSKYTYLSNPNFVVKNQNDYFKSTVTWSKISSSFASFRYAPAGMLFEVAGACMFADEVELKYVQAFCNTSIAQTALSFMSPTLNYEVGQIAQLPVIESSDSIDGVGKKVDACRDISKSDLDSFETSWDFKRHPLV